MQGKARPFTKYEVIVYNYVGYLKYVSLSAMELSLCDIISAFQYER